MLETENQSESRAQLTSIKYEIHLKNELSKIKSINTQCPKEKGAEYH